MFPTVPLPYVAIATVATFFFNWVSDGPLNGLRWPMIFLQTVAVVSTLLFFPALLSVK